MRVSPMLPGADSLGSMRGRRQGESKELVKYGPFLKPTLAQGATAGSTCLCRRRGRVRPGSVVPSRRPALPLSGERVADSAGTRGAGGCGDPCRGTGGAILARVRPGWAGGEHRRLEGPIVLRHRHLVGSRRGPARAPASSAAVATGRHRPDRRGGGVTLAAAEPDHRAGAAGGTAQPGCGAATATASRDASDSRVDRSSPDRQAAPW